MGVSSETMSITAPRPYAGDGRTLTDADEDGKRLLEALEDAGCRGILESTGDGAMSASELSSACDISLSTTYRKLDLLTDTGLLEESIRIRRSGKHTSEYARCVDDIHLTVGGDGGMEMRLERR